MALSSDCCSRPGILEFIGSSYRNSRRKIDKNILGRNSRHNANSARQTLSLPAAAQLPALARAKPYKAPVAAR